MDPLVEQEYTFDIYSARYGHFLVDVYNAYPEVLVRKSGSAIRIKVPEEAAVMLKLKYGDSIMKPTPQDQMDMLIKMLRNKEVFYDDDSMINLDYKDEDGF
jgi:hypothetical protein